MKFSFLRNWIVPCHIRFLTDNNKQTNKEFVWLLLCVIITESCASWCPQRQLGTVDHRGASEEPSPCAFAQGWTFISGVWWWLTCPCVCLCASRWPVTLWPCTLDRSRRAMSISVSQIDIDRSLDRLINQSRFPGQSLDQSICVCRCLYKEQHLPTRSYFCRKILRLVDLFSISSSHPLDLSTSHASVLPIHQVATSFILCDRTERITLLILERLRLVLSIAATHIKHRTNPRTRRRIDDAGRTKNRIAIEKVRTKCRGTWWWGRPRKWDRKEDDAPTTDLGSSNEANALC